MTFISKLISNNHIRNCEILFWELRTRYQIKAHVLIEKVITIWPTLLIFKPASIPGQFKYACNLGDLAAKRFPLLLKNKRLFCLNAHFTWVATVLSSANKKNTQRERERISISRFVMKWMLRSLLSLSAWIFNAQFLLTLWNMYYTRCAVEFYFYNV